MLPAGEREAVRMMELEVGGVENLTDLIVFCHRLPIVDEKNFQNLRHIQLHFGLLATLLLPSPNETTS